MNETELDWEGGPRLWFIGFSKVRDTGREGGKVVGQQSGLLFCQGIPYDSGIKLSAPSDGIDLAMGVLTPNPNPHCFYLLAGTDLIWPWKFTHSSEQKTLCPDGSLDLDFYDNQHVMGCAAWYLFPQVRLYETHQMEYISLTATMGPHKQDCDSRWQMVGKLRNAKPRNRSVQQTEKLAVCSTMELKELQGHEL